MYAAKSSVETKIVRLFWNDGLLDLLSGAAILMIGIAWLADLPAMGAVAPAILVPLWKPLRQRFTEPYMGMVEFSQSHQTRNRSFLATSIAIGVILLLAGITLYFLANRPTDSIEMKRVVQGVPAVAIGLMAIMTASITSLSRFHVYGGFLVLLGCVAAILQTGPAWPMVVGGALVAITGLFVFAQFQKRMRTHSGQGKGAQNDV